MQNPKAISSRKGWKSVVIKDFKMNKYKYLIVLPIIIYLIIFNYKPMYGLIIAFKNFRVTLGFADSPWVGLDHFKAFFNDIFFTRLLRNTFTISGLSIIFGFPAPIILALLINEVRNQKFKRVIQTVTYMPHFISIVIVCGLLVAYTQSNGAINDIVAFFGGERTNLLARKEMFYPIYILSGIWQSAGWSSIIYLAAITGIDQEQYEAAKVDGAGRFRQMISITLPGLMPTIIVLFILQMGSILSVGHEKILLLYKPLTYEVADVISTYVYRRGIIEANYSYSTAIGLFNSVVNITFLLITNKLSKRINETSLF